MKKKYQTILATVLAVTLIVTCYPMADDTPDPTDTETDSETATETDTETDSETESGSWFLFDMDQGKIWIQLPKDNDDWAQIQDPSSLAAISDGTDMITVNFESDEKPADKKEEGDGNYREVYQQSFGTDGGNYIVTGYMSNDEDSQEIKESVDNFEFYYPEDTDDLEYEIGEVKKNGYCTGSDGAYVYDLPSMNVGSVIGIINYGETVAVTGIVKDDQFYSGWLRIDQDGETGYVYASFFSYRDPKRDIPDLTDDIRKEIEKREQAAKEYDPAKAEEAKAEEAAKNVINEKKAYDGRRVYIVLDDSVGYEVRLNVRLVDYNGKARDAEYLGRVKGPRQNKIMCVYFFSDVDAYLEVAVEKKDGGHWICPTSYDRYDKTVLNDRKLSWISCSSTWTYKGFDFHTEPVYFPL